MKPFTIDIDLDDQDRDGIAQAQNITGDTAMTLNGALGTTLDIARIIGIYSAANCSSAEFTIVGTDANGRDQTETGITGPNNSTVVSTKFFKTITSVTPSASVAQNVEVGTVATTLVGESKIYPCGGRFVHGWDFMADVTGTIDADVLYTFQDVQIDDLSTISWRPVIDGYTSNTQAGGNNAAIMAVKVQINSYSAGADTQVHVIGHNRRSS